MTLLSFFFTFLHLSLLYFVKPCWIFFNLHNYAHLCLLFHRTTYSAKNHQESKFGNHKHWNHQDYWKWIDNSKCVSLLIYNQYITWLSLFNTWQPTTLHSSEVQQNKRNNYKNRIIELIIVLNTPFKSINLSNIITKEYMKGRS